MQAGVEEVPVVQESALATDPSDFMQFATRFGEEHPEEIPVGIAMEEALFVKWLKEPGDKVVAGKKVDVKPGNAMEIAQCTHENQFRSIIVVTSAWHMPRARLASSTATSSPSRESWGRSAHRRRHRRHRLAAARRL